MARGPGQILAVRASMRRADRPRVPALCRDSHPASLIALGPVYGLSPPCSGNSLPALCAPMAAPAMGCVPYFF
jgi:hypothetical protein